MNELLAKIPKPVLVVVVLMLAIGLFILNDPLKDECEVQAKVFERSTRGILSGIKKNGKIQFAVLSPMRDRCKEGNSIGACSDYFEVLRKITNELKVFKDTCQIKYAEANEGFPVTLAQALQVMSLVAWGEKPPASTAERAGWLIEPQIKTFCSLKKSYILLAGEESYTSLKNKIFMEYPDVWPETATAKDIEDFPEKRPKALKSVLNPKGKFEKNKIFELSLFSIRCDLFL